MKRKVLYHPNFVPPHQWLKDSSIYFDQVSSIVPEDRTDTINTPDLNYLQDVGLYEAISPVPFYNDQNFRESFNRDFERHIGSELDENPYDPEIYEIASSKVSFQVRERISESFGINIQGDSFRFPKRTGHLFMSLLAGHVTAFNGYEHYTPGTDRFEAEVSLVGSSPKKEAKLAWHIALEGVLPSVRPDVSLRKLAEFRLEREAELIGFRLFLAKELAEISNASSTAEVTELITDLREKLIVSSSDFKRLFDDIRDESIQSWFSAFLDIKSPPVLGAALGVVGMQSLGPFGIAGGIGLGVTATLVKRFYDQGKQDRKISSHALSYLYSLRRDGIVH